MTCIRNSIILWTNGAKSTGTPQQYFERLKLLYQYKIYYIFMVSIVDRQVWKRVKVNFVNPNISCDVTLGIYTFQKSSTTIMNYFYKPWLKWMGGLLKLTSCLLATGCHFKKSSVHDCKMHRCFYSALLVVFKVSLKKGPTNITPWGKIFWDLGKLKLLDWKTLMMASLL